MIHYQRPPEPEGFRDRTREARLAVEQAIQAGNAPAFDEAPWKDYKGALASAQRGKCAYCEMFVANQDSHVEHFAPKAAVWELSPEPSARGREIEPGLSNIRGRKPAQVCARGYWWLAYEWTNYLVTCSVCNTKWKQCYFPVDAQPRKLPPEADTPEPPLLLNPFDDLNPWRHFQFDRFGQVTEANRSKRGRATIDICGLSLRESLRLARAGIADDAYRHARRFVALSGESMDDSKREQCNYALENLCELGGDDRAHAGMVRAIAEQETGLSWDELVQLQTIGLATATIDGNTLA